MFIILHYVIKVEANFGFLSYFYAAFAGDQVPHMTLFKA